MDSKTDIGKGLKIIATIAVLLVTFSTLIAGVVDTKVRVNVLERDNQTLDSRFEQYLTRNREQYSSIQDSLHKIDKAQASLDERFKSLVEWIVRQQP